MWLNALGWTATAVFSSAYFFKQPSFLRKIQAIAALLWVIYGIAIGSAPVAVANTIVGVAAIYTAFRAGLIEERAEVGIEKPRPSDETVDGREEANRDGKKQTGRSLMSELLAAASRLSYVPAQGKDGTPAYILSVGTIAWCGALPGLRHPVEPRS